MQKKFMHLLWAIINSVGILSVSIALLFLSVLLVGKIEDGQVVSFFLGVLASIIATLILRISEKYANSLAASSVISNKIELMLLYIEEHIVTDKYDSKNCFYQLWRYYMEICEVSVGLTYKKDFKNVSCAISGLLKAIKEGKSSKEICTQKDSLAQLKETIQFL